MTKKYIDFILKIYRDLYGLLIPITGGFLLLVPHFWFRNNTYNIGGDDTRLYYLFPELWLENMIGSVWNSQSGLSIYNPQFQTHFYTSILNVFFNYIFPSINRQSLTYGFLLFFAFIYVYRLVKILSDLGLRKKSNSISINAYIASLFYIFAPLSQIIWINPLSNIYLYAYIPILVYYFIKSVLKNKFVYFLHGLIISLPFTAGFNSYPYVFAFLLSLLLLSALLFFISKNKWYYIKNLFLCTSITVLLYSFWLLPLGRSFFSTSFINNGIAMQGKLDPIQVNFNLLETLSLSISKIFTPSYLHINNIFFVILVTTIILSVPLYLLKLPKIKAEKFKIYYIFVFLSILNVFLYTANITNYGIDVYNLLLKYIPGFDMFRNPFSKFPLVLVYFYSITIGLALSFHQRFFRYRPIIYIVKGFIIFFLLYKSVFLINGDLVKTPFTTSGFHRNIVFPSSYTDIVSCLPKDLGYRVIYLPLNEGGWSLITNTDYNSVYLGTSPLRILAGVDEINGTLSYFSIPTRYRNMLMTSLKDSNYEQLFNTFQNLNIKYILVNKLIYKQYSTDYAELILYDKSFYTNLVNNIPNEVICDSSMYSLLKIVDKNPNYRYGFNIYGYTGAIKNNLYKPGLYSFELKDNVSGFSILLPENYHPGWKIETSVPVDKVEHSDREGYNYWNIELLEESRDISVRIIFSPNYDILIGIIMSLFTLIIVVFIILRQAYVFSKK